MNKQVAIAISGGIDSAISAYILKEMGFEVIGVYFKFWKWKKDHQESAKNHDVLLDDIRKKIGIKIQILAYENYFKNTIVNSYISGLLGGQTPNPCVKCNPLVKFKLLRKFANKEKIEFISTGHYVRVEKDKKGLYR